ncbi:MAG: hypothetical protein ACYTG7_06420 [Planctomycetota bacterium]|jgi:chromosome segregation ATPase
MIFAKHDFRLIPLWMGMAFFLSGCLQLETPHNFREEEEARIRAKNMSSYYKELEDQIEEEKTHIKLLQDTLNLYITREQTLADEVKKREEAYNSRKKDLDALDADVTGVEARISEQAKKRQELEKALKEEQRKVAKLEQDIAGATARIENLKAKLSGAKAEVKELEAKQPPSQEAPPAQEKPKQEPKQEPPPPKPPAEKPAETTSPAKKPAEQKATSPKEPAEKQSGT